MPTPAVDTAFNQEQYDLTYSLGAERHFWNFARNRIIERNLRKTLPSATNETRVVLDVGCGPGIMVDHLRQRNINCHGVELGRPKVRPNLETYIQTGTAAIALPAALRERVSTVLLLDVIEHIEEPVGFIAELKTALPALEHLIVTVPARKELWSNYDEHFGHFRRYDLQTLRAFAHDANLNVLTCKYLFHSLYPAMWLASHRPKQRSLDMPVPSSGGNFVHSLIGTAFNIEEQIPLLDHVVGTSALGVFSVSR
jgi:SAM-dependent methyltransferase